MDSDKGGCDNLAVLSAVNSSTMQWNLQKPKMAETACNGGNDDDDDECVVLEGDPEKPMEVTNDGDNSDELLVVGEKGQVACRDFPHARHLCAKFRFASTPHQMFCEQCHCYVCDSLAPCAHWGSGTKLTDHCHATDKEAFWLAQRKSLQECEKETSGLPSVTAGLPQTPPISSSTPSFTAGLPQTPVVSPLTLSFRGLPQTPAVSPSTPSFRAGLPQTPQVSQSTPSQLNSMTQIQGFRQVPFVPRSMATNCASPNTINKCRNIPCGCAVPGDGYQVQVQVQVQLASRQAQSVCSGNVLSRDGRNNAGNRYPHVNQRDMFKRSGLAGASSLCNKNGYDVRRNALQPTVSMANQIPCQQTTMYHAANSMYPQHRVPPQLGNRYPNYIPSQQNIAAPKYSNFCVTTSNPTQTQMTSRAQMTTGLVCGVASRSQLASQLNMGNNLGNLVPYHNQVVFQPSGLLSSQLPASYQSNGGSCFGNQPESQSNISSLSSVGSCFGNQPESQSNMSSLRANFNTIGNLAPPQLHSHGHPMLSNHEQNVFQQENTSGNVFRQLNQNQNNLTSSFSSTVDSNAALNSSNQPVAADNMLLQSLVPADSINRQAVPTKDDSQLQSVAPADDIHNQTLATKDGSQSQSVGLDSESLQKDGATEDTSSLKNDIDTMLSGTDLQSLDSASDSWLDNHFRPGFWELSEPAFIELGTLLNY